MHDLMQYLLDGEQRLDDLPRSLQNKLTDVFDCIRKIPMLDILRLIDRAKTNKICVSIEKIVGLAHVSQSMGDYFARDDALDPALSTVCQALTRQYRYRIHFEKAGEGGG